ncbi:MAG: aldo/keto reductase, partial [Acidobacteriota bacterium]
MDHSRRSFLKAGVAAGALASVNTLHAERASATDWVTLGKSNIKVTRLALGTGTFSGRVQQSLGQDGFTRLVRYAYDRGIRFFETSESYGRSQQMLAAALSGIPRENYRLMSKVTTTPGGDPMKSLDQMRRDSNTEYFDIMLLHWQHTADWPEETKRWQDALLQAQEQKKILSHGASVHGLPALRQVPDMSWLEIAMIRMNHKGVRMDAEVPDTNELGDVPEVVKHVQQARAHNLGVISMKLAGEGAF